VRMQVHKMPINVFGTDQACPFSPPLAALSPKCCLPGKCRIDGTMRQHLAL
jgi:hypothetical protein